MYNSSTHLWLPAGAGGVRSLTGRWGEWVNRPSFRTDWGCCDLLDLSKDDDFAGLSEVFLQIHPLLQRHMFFEFLFVTWQQQVSSSFDADSWRVAFGGTFCTAQLHAEDTDGAGRPLPSIELLQSAFFGIAPWTWTPRMWKTHAVWILSIYKWLVVVVYLSINLWWPVFSSNHLPVAVSFQYCRLPNANTLMHGIAVQHDITRLDTTWLDNMIFALLSISHVVTWHCIANSCALHLVPSHILPYLP